MNKREKKEFIRELCRSLEAQLLASVERMPEEWDGVELRRLAAEKMHEANWSNHKLRGQTLRGKAYQNAVYNNHL